MRGDDDTVSGLLIGERPDGGTLEQPIRCPPPFMFCHVVAAWRIIAPVCPDDVQWRAVRLR